MRPANFQTPGKGVAQFARAQGRDPHLMARLFMDLLDDPLLRKRCWIPGGSAPMPTIVLDFHGGHRAENGDGAFPRRAGLGCRRHHAYSDGGRPGIPGGTGYMTDLGMRDYDSVIGHQKSPSAIHTQMPAARRLCGESTPTMRPVRPRPPHPGRLGNCRGNRNWQTGIGCPRCRTSITSVSLTGVSGMDLTPQVGAPMPVAPGPGNEFPCGYISLAARGIL